MENNPSVSLEALMIDDDARKILSQAKYKP